MLSSRWEDRVVRAHEPVGTGIGRWLLACLCTGLLLVPAWSWAQALGPYEGEVAVASQSEADRQAALPAALEQVLLKQGAPASLAAAHEVSAANLLQQYRYRQDAIAADAAGQRQLYLIARFDEAGVRKLLGDNGAARWTREQPRPILWLAIDDGSGARIVNADAAAAVGALTTRANQRGIPLRLPQYDSSDQAVLMARDLAGEETWSVDTVTARHGGPALIGWMRRDAEGWVVDWRLRDGGSELGRWRSQDEQAVVVLAAGADGAADLLMQRGAQAAFTGQPGRYSIVIEGVDSGAGYARLMALLRRQPIVIAVQPSRLEASRLEAELELSAGVESLARLLRGSALDAIFVGDLETPSEFAYQAR